MTADAILRDLADKLPGRPAAGPRRVWIALMVVGAATFAYLLATNPLRAWGTWTINTLYFLGIAMGGVVIAAAIRLCNGRWGGPMMRIGESLTAFLPAGSAAVVILLVAGIWTYLPWIGHVQPRQAAFLNVPFLYARTLAGLALFWWLARKLVDVSLRPDLQLLKPFVRPELKADYEKRTANWRGDEAERASYSHEAAHLSPQVTLAFVVVFSVLSWDFIMALTPNWASPLFGWFCYAGAFVGALAVTHLLAVQLRRRWALEAYITPNMSWDLGKVLFSFCIFWAYLFWSQYLPIWYANMPDETWWVFLRFEQPWRSLAFAAFTMIFVIPFLGMLNKPAKTNPLLVTAFSLTILVGLWIERHVLVMPSLDAAHRWVGLPEIGVTLGFLGVFGWCVQGFMSRYPVIRVVEALERATASGH